MFPISDPQLTRRRFPVVNVVIIALCSIVFLYEVFILNDFELSKFYNNYGVVPYELTGRGDISEKVQALVEKGDRSALEIEGVEGMLVQQSTSPFAVIFAKDIRDPYAGGPPTVWFTIFTSMFIHGGWMHLIGNMLFLWVFGDNVEDRLGRVKYLFFYIIAGLFAAAAQVLVNLDTGVPAIGASGAIAGVLGAYFVLFPHSQIRTLVWFFLITLISVPAWLLIGIWVVMQFFSGFVSLGGEFADGVAYWAHIGGFVAGFLIVAAFVGISRVRRIFSGA